MHGRFRRSDWVLLALLSMEGQKTAEDIDNFIYMKTGSAFDVASQIAKLQTEGLVTGELVSARNEQGYLSGRRKFHFRLTKAGQERAEKLARMLSQFIPRKYWR